MARTSAAVALQSSADSELLMSPKKPTASQRRRREQQRTNESERITGRERGRERFPGQIGTAGREGTVASVSGKLRYT